jgi:hypothetical protein
MKISQRLIIASTVDLRKVVPKQKFKGWKPVAWKKDIVILDGPEKIATIHMDARGPDPVIMISHPKDWGSSLAPNDLEGTYSSVGDRLTYKSKPDVEDWDAVKGPLAKFFLAVIKKAAA